MTESDSNFKKFFDTAVLAEARRKSYEDNGTSGAKLDPAGGVTVSKVDTASSKK